jgi:hypothetical protein
MVIETAVPVVIGLVAEKDHGAFKQTRCKAVSAQDGGKEKSCQDETQVSSSTRLTRR